MADSQIPRPKRSSKLSDAIRHEIAEKYADRYPARVLANEYRISKNTVMRIAAAHGVARNKQETGVFRRDLSYTRRRQGDPPKPEPAPGSRVPEWIKALEPAIVALYQDGMSVRALVRRFGIGHNSIQRMLERNGVHRRNEQEVGVFCRTRTSQVPIHPDPTVSIAMQVARHMGYESSRGLSSNREFRTACNREYAARHPEVYRQNERKRKEAENRIPAWQDRRELDAFWDLANSLGVEVDHINPLQGDDISGLNVITNLQMLPKLENYRKYNKFVCGPDFTMPPYAPVKE